METKDWKALTHLFEKLNEICQSKTSGALYFTSKDEHVGGVWIKDGEIIRFRYHTDRGEEAIKAVQSLSQVSFRFTSKRVINIEKDTSLPETVAILAMLNLAIL